LHAPKSSSRSTTPTFSSPASRSTLTRKATNGAGGKGCLEAEGHGEHVRKDFDLASRAENLARAHRLASYRVSTTPPGNVRVSTKFRFTPLSSAVKNGGPLPTRPGWVTIVYSSISPAHMAAPASVAPPMPIGPPSSALSRVISATASPVTRRVFQSTLSIVDENTTFGVSRQFRANPIFAGEASGCWSPVGQ